eukprot:3200472-Pleurochrysis_carterae.AAC.2
MARARRLRQRLYTSTTAAHAGLIHRARLRSDMQRWKYGFAKSSLHSQFSALSSTLLSRASRFT